MSVRISKGHARGAELISPEGPADDRSLESPDYPLLALRNQIDRLFEDFFRDVGPPFRWRAASFGPFGRLETEFGTRGQVTPRADIVESPEAYLITVELPGLSEDEIDVSLVDDLLIVDAEKTRHLPADASLVRLAERLYGTVHRSFRIPAEADQDGISATFDNGLLSIVVPKSANEGQSRKRIEVKAE